MLTSTCALTTHQPSRAPRHAHHTSPPCRPKAAPPGLPTPYTHTGLLARAFREGWVQAPHMGVSSRLVTTIPHPNVAQKRENDHPHTRPSYPQSRPRTTHLQYDVVDAQGHNGVRQHHYTGSNTKLRAVSAPLSQRWGPAVSPWPGVLDVGLGSAPPVSQWCTHAHHQS